MRILYVGRMAPYDSAYFRVLALRREGHEVRTINSLDYGMSHPVLRKLEFRAAWGPEVNRLNLDILHVAEEWKPEIFWADKVLFLRPETLARLRSIGVLSVSYMIDNYFGPRQDPGWRLYAKTIPLFDLHCTQRDVNVRQYFAAGARDVIKIQTAFEPTVHFPPLPEWNDTNRCRDVSFVGTPYDNRADFLTRLSQEFGFSVKINGGAAWEKALASSGGRHLYDPTGELRNDDYREAIWKSRINLSFLTHSNQDEFVHKSFEIAACGGFLLAERSAGHASRFQEDVEAVFFSDIEECAQKIRQYLPDEQARNRIAQAGCKRAWSSGYDNDTQVRRIVERVEKILLSGEAAQRGTV